MTPRTSIHVGPPGRTVYVLPCSVPDDRYAGHVVVLGSGRLECRAGLESARLSTACVM